MAQTGTVGFRYSGANGLMFSPSTTASWGIGLQIGDPTSAASAAYAAYVAGNVGNNTTWDVKIESGGPRSNSILAMLGFANSTPKIDDERQSVDGICDVIYLWSNDFRQCSVKVGDLQLQNGNGIQQTGNYQLQLSTDAGFNNPVVVSQNNNSKVGLLIHQSAAPTLDPFQIQTNGGTVVSGAQPGGTLKTISVTFANLGSASGAIGDPFKICADCIVATPCAGGGGGALAVSINGVWACK